MFGCLAAVGGMATVYTAGVDAGPLLGEVARQLNGVTLEAVLIGNAAAALHGAPVTTVDFDFMFRKTPRNMTRLKALARGLGATILRPYYPASDLYRLVRDDDGLQVDFMATIHGVRSFAGLRDRAVRIEVGGAPILVASLADVIKSKRAARRPRDLAVLDILEKTLEEGAQQANAPDRPRPRK
jgi:predicted nucleotidyltransferase